MIKIPSLFKRNIDPTIPPGKSQALYLQEVTPGCEWAHNGEGVATIKWDGTAVLVKGGRLYARLDCKLGIGDQKKVPVPSGAIPCQDPDPITGHWPHWIIADRPQDRWIREAWDYDNCSVPDGTYEAVGPRIGSNKEGLSTHILVRHGSAAIQGPIPRTFESCKNYLELFAWEGIVFHHSDGRMCKVTKQGFGWTRSPVENPEEAFNRVVSSHHGAVHQNAF